MRRIAFVAIIATCGLGLASCGGGDAGDVSAADIEGLSIFQAAADPKLAAELAAIIDSGADVNATDNQGFAVLHYAVVADNGDAVRLLLQAEADPAVKDAQGRSPEEMAEQEGRLNAVQAFERYGQIR